MYGSVEHEATEALLSSPNKKSILNKKRIGCTALILFLLILCVLSYNYFQFGFNHFDKKDVMVIEQNPIDGDNDIFNRIGGEIRGGDDASGTEYPWIASWRYYGGHCCTGSLINQNPPIVLTAAHCSSCGTSNDIDLGRTATTGTDSDSDSFDIDYIIQYPSYGSPTALSYDVSMVVLEGTTSREVINLVNPKIAARDVFPQGTPMDILGYGYLNQADTIPSTQLQIGEINYWTKANCYAQLNDQCSLGAYWDEDAMLCGWDYSESTEAGDSGGPALMNGLLSGINSWSPRSCSDSRIVDVFTDVGSVRHWIENNKPTYETYIVGIHICDDTWAWSPGPFSIRLLGTEGYSSWISNALSTTYSDQDTLLQIDGFNVFKYTISNIGWTVESVSFKTDQSDAVCIDSVVAGRLDGPQLMSGRAREFWIDNPCDGSLSPCYTSYELTLYEFCNADPDLSSSLKLDANLKHPIQSNTDLKTLSLINYYYAVIIHTCDETYAYSPDSFYARLHGSRDTTEWFQLQNDAMTSTTLTTDSVYIYYIDADTYIGLDVESIDFQSVDNDATCIDFVAAGRAGSPHYWKGNSDKFWLDNPCSYFSDPCYEYHSIPLYCYDF